METMYNDEQIEDYIRDQLGMPQEATKVARSSLFHLVGGKAIYLPPSAVRNAIDTVPLVWLADT